ncbi:hypothetical protein [Providencia sneebia]|uniref:Uncharacterized protein n=1 Tax=Providencia sneebia DSM 19967 TaxID=1141660 RepID=K8W9M2_9GAMM|nr:hypothetical protein [Providencia sneebia]EKT57348.1 hypothetical protein OO7_08165 [Providencia sneebia DSM 19967]
MKNVKAILITIMMFACIAMATLLIVFPQQWKQNVYPSISKLLPESMNSLVTNWGAGDNVCDRLENNLQIFADYLKTNEDVVNTKAMNGLDDQITSMRSRVNSMPNQVRKLVCQQEYARLEGLKGVFFLGSDS